MNNLPNRSQTERLATSADLGLTRKQVHEARQVRDAEKAKPGIVRKTLDAQLEAHKEPTRAAVKNAIKDKPAKKKAKQPRLNETMPAEVAAVRILDDGATYAQMERETGLSNTVLRSAVARLEGQRKIEVDRDDLSMSAQQKLDAALRRYQHQLDIQFRQKVLDEVKKRIDEIVLPSWKERLDEAQRIFHKRRGIMDKATFNRIRRGLHPDSRHSISDKLLGEAFDTFMGLEKLLLDEQQSPTEFPKVPDNLAEWDKMRAAAAAERKAKRGKANIARR